MSLTELHGRLQKHLDAQAAEWKSFAYASNGNGFYQGYSRIGIEGARQTEQRWAAYQLEPFLNREMNALDIG